MGTQTLREPTATPTLLPDPPPAPGLPVGLAAGPNSGVSVRGRHISDSSDPTSEEGGTLRTVAWGDGILFGHKKERRVDASYHGDEPRRQVLRKRRWTQAATS